MNVLRFQVQEYPNPWPIILKIQLFPVNLAHRIQRKPKSKSKSKSKEAESYHGHYFVLKKFGHFFIKV